MVVKSQDCQIQENRIKTSWLIMSQPFPTQALVFTCLQYKVFENTLQYKVFENTVGKGEIAHQVQFLLFPQCFHAIRNYLPQTLSVWKSLKFVIWERVNFLPNNKILVLPKLKVFSGDNLNLVCMMEFFFDRVEKIEGKGKTAGNKHFLLVQNCFQKVC